ncbi:MAG: TlpA family protein disulfide reductase [Planctomycetaceae bacterium]
MSKLFRLAAFACVVTAIDPLSIASAPPSKSSKQPTATKQSSAKPKALVEVPPGTSNAKKTGKNGRPSGQELAKEFKENIKKTGSLTGRHHPKIDSAIKSAKARKKNLLLVFVTQSCPHCVKMMKTLDDRKFKDRFVKDYNLLVVDCDRSRDVAEHYLYDPKVPHTKIINGNGQIVRQITGYSDDEKLADFLAAK